MAEVTPAELRFDLVPSHSVPAPVLDVAHTALRLCERILGIPVPRLFWVRQNRTGPLGRFDWSSNGHHRILIAVPPDVTPRSLAMVLGVTLHECRHYWQAVARWSMSACEEAAQEADAVQWSEKILEAMVQIFKNEDPTATLAELKGMLR